MTDIALPVVELADFAGIGIETHDAVARFCESQTQRQPYITASDYPDFELCPFEILRFALQRHVDKVMLLPGFDSSLKKGV
jgi:hypothetical protein